MAILKAFSKPLRWFEQRCSFQRGDSYYSFNNFPIRNAFSVTGDRDMSRYGFNGLFSVLARLNFRNFCEKADINPDNCVCIKPEHKDKIIVVEKNNVIPMICDGLFTSVPKLSLLLFPADCFSLIITDRNGEFVGLIHCGGKSVELNIVKKAVLFSEKLFKANPEELIVAIGPGIGAWTCVHHTRLLDKIFKQLLSSGINNRSIFPSYFCTYCVEDVNGNPLFFSHLRSGDTGEPDFRFAVAVQIK